MKRDLKADLELCNKATPGPWVFNGISVLGAHGLLIARTPNDADAEFIAQAREGWPHAIERAIKAEALAKRLVEALEKFVVNVAWELTEQEHLLNLVKEVLEDD